jgi:hypothetical protein
MSSGKRSAKKRDAAITVEEALRRSPRDRFGAFRTLRLRPLRTAGGEHGEPSRVEGTARAAIEADLRRRGWID